MSSESFSAEHILLRHRPKNGLQRWGVIFLVIYYRSNTRMCGVEFCHCTLVTGFLYAGLFQDNTFWDNVQKLFEGPWWGSWRV